jgi:hypothetical protein
MDLPDLDCPTFANVTLAETTCQGNFLMWGEFFNETTGTTQSAFLEDERAEYGPYFCSTCLDGQEGYGYVGDDTVLPDLVDNTCNDDCTSQCPVKIFESLEDTSCAGLQKHCEQSGHGWLTYAKSFVSYEGQFVCSGGCTKLFEEEIDFGYQVIALSGHATDLRSWPMFFMWALIGIMLAAATSIDFKLYQGNAKEWFARYFFSFLGYTNLEGRQNPFWGQVCVNPCTCLCACNCCDCKDPVAPQDEDESNEMAPARIGFLSLLILSLGVAILFGDGNSFDQVCFFNGVPPSNKNETNYDVALPHAFRETIFGQDGPFEVKDTDPTVKIWDKEWWVAELAIVMYEMAQELLAYNLVNAGYLGLKTTLCLMVVNSSIFLLCCWSVNRGIVWGNVWKSWFLGFIFAILFTPFFNAMAYCLASCVVKRGCLPGPRKEDIGDKNKKDASTAPQKDTKVDAIAEKQLFKVVIPAGMEPGQQLKVHMGDASNGSHLVTIPNRELWQSETIVDSNGEMVLQYSFYVETQSTQPEGSSSGSVDMTGEVTNVAWCF